jgi:SAM-dependent methyltransferase
VVLDGLILRNRQEIKRLCGETTLRTIEEFRQRGAASLPPETWYEGFPQDDNLHPWAHRSWEDVLNEVPDLAARKYLKVAAHSDLATEPDLTNGLNGLKNCLMDVRGYIALYSVDGGMEMFPQALGEHLERTKIELKCPVARIEKSPDGTYRVAYRRGQEFKRENFDVVFVCLPHNSLGSVEWSGKRLQRAMARHIDYYDRPAHYLRVSVLFKQPFWRKLIADSWFILDAFGGCCVYDEGARSDVGKYGVLSWLLAGADALSNDSLDDRTLTRKVLDTLPEQLRQEAGQLLIEAKVHRWLNSVNGQPGGLPVRDNRSAHLPEPLEHEGIFVVGDYLFDSTINGVLDSADYATDLLQAWALKRRLLRVAATASGISYLSKNGQKSPSSAATNGSVSPSFGSNGASVGGFDGNHAIAAALLKKSKVDRSYFLNYYEDLSYEESFHEYFDAKYVTDLIKLAWQIEPPYRLLDAGSASGLTLELFAEQRVEAWGVEKNKYIHSLTRQRLKKRNLLGDIRKLPFADDYFDFVYETCLAYVPEAQLARALKELCRVTRRGVIFASITSDMNPELFNRPNMLGGMKTLMTLWEWAELFMANGFKLAVTQEKTLARIWRCDQRCNADDDDWYPNADSMRYCFYTKVRNENPALKSLIHSPAVASRG